MSHALAGGEVHRAHQAAIADLGDIVSYAVASNPISNFRTIYAGFAGAQEMMGPPPNSSPIPIRAEGERNTAPIGLGYLLDGGYLGDVRVFFCQTAGGAMPVDDVNTYAACNSIFICDRYS